MYITLTGIQNGEPASLARNLSARARVERWYNISSTHENNVVNEVHVTRITDGYYNVCELNEDAFKPFFGAELHLLTPNGRLQMSARKRLVLNRGLAKLLGFARDEFEPGKTYIADKPHRLVIHREICLHLAEITISDNLHNGRPSTLLISVPVEKVWGRQDENIPYLAVKKVSSGAIPQLTLMILDVSGKQLNFDYLISTLHIRNG